MNNSLDELKQNMAYYQYNPAAIQSVICDIVDDINNDKIKLVDATNPFILGLEAAAIGVTNFLDEHNNSVRSLYPALATNELELYKHMSDIDFVDRFSKPSTCNFVLGFQLFELESNLVDDINDNSKKIIIPRNTTFIVSDVHFSLQYPIVIRQFIHGGLQVMYDASVASPLLDITDNIIEYEIKTIQGVEWLFFKVEATQFNINSIINDVNSGVETNLNVSFNNQYYHCRVYLTDSTGKWVEIKTTHTDLVYDPYTVTAVLKVSKDFINIKIPQVYTQSIITSCKIRIDVYSTLGVVNIPMREKNLNDFGVMWLAIDNLEFTEYSAPLKTIRGFQLYSIDHVIGGRNSLSFLDLRKKVIDNTTGKRKRPITTIELEADLSDLNYSLITYVDNITNRVFLATDSFGDDNLDDSKAVALSSVNTRLCDVVITPDKINNNFNIINNSDLNSFTILDNSLFNLNNNRVNILSNSDIVNLKSLSKNVLVDNLNQNKYLFSPFRYVVEYTDNNVLARPYYIDPLCNSKTFVSMSTIIEPQVNIGEYEIIKTTFGFKIVIKTKSNKEYKDIPKENLFCQLSFIPVGESDLVFINGDFIDITDTEEYVIEFNLITNHFIDKDDNMFFTNFKMHTDENIITKVKMTHSFNVSFSTTLLVYQTYNKSAVDAFVNNKYLPDFSLGITHEKLNIKLGTSLNRLYTKAKVVTESIEYERYTTDVPLTYTKTIYQTDENNNAVLFDSSNTPYVNVLHNIGDIVRNELGEIVYAHRANEIKLDSFGNPIQINNRHLSYSISMLMIDGLYYFTDDLKLLEQIKTVISIVVDKINVDMNKIQSKLFEQSSIYYLPQNRLGKLDVTINGSEKQIESEQVFTVKLYLPNIVFNNNALKQILEANTIKTIETELRKTLITKDSLVEALRKTYGDDVTGFDVYGLGAITDSIIIIINNNLQRMSIKKKALLKQDNTLTVVNDITVIFDKNKK